MAPKRAITILVFLMAVALSATGCARSSTTAGARQPRTIVVDQQDTGKTIDARPGDRLLFRLSSRMDWKVRSYPPVVRPLGPETRWRSLLARGRFTFVATRSGSGTIDATGAVPCPKLEVCPGTDVTFSVTVRVS